MGVLLGLALAACNIGKGGGALTPDGDGPEDGDVVVEDGDGVPVDGDQPDGDTPPDGDEERIVECIGACSATDPVVCAGPDLCVCRESVLSLENCQQTCERYDLGDSRGCAFVTENQRFECRCTRSPVPCVADIIVSELPFTHTGNTRGREDAFGLAPSCFDWAVPGPDYVYRLDVVSGQRLRIALTPLDLTYDPALVLALSCSTHAECLDGRDRGWSGAMEELTYTVMRTRPLWIVVDSGYQPDASESSGQYQLEIVDISAVDGDGDEDGDLDLDEESDQDADEDDDLDWDADPEDDTESDLEGDSELEEDGDLDDDLLIDGDTDTDAELEAEQA